MAVTFSDAYTCFNNEILCTLIKVGFCRLALKFGQGHVLYLMKNG